LRGGLPDKIPKYRFSLQVKRFGPPQILGWMRHCRDRQNFFRGPQVNPPYVSTTSLWNHSYKTILLLSFTLHWHYCLISHVEPCTSAELPDATKQTKDYAWQLLARHQCMFTLAEVAVLLLRSRSGFLPCDLRQRLLTLLCSNN